MDCCLVEQMAALMVPYWADSRALHSGLSLVYRKGWRSDYRSAAWKAGQKEERSAGQRDYWKDNR
jgi:hypothetical protein